MPKSEFDKILDGFDKPFEPDEVEWRVDRVVFREAGPCVIVLPYIQARAIFQRLDDVVGKAGWRTTIQKHADGVYCGIGVYNHETQQWIEKWDGAENSNIEAFKGGISGAVKRSAVQWGMGKELYTLPIQTVLVEKRGEHWVKSKAKDRTGKEVQVTGYWNTPDLVAIRGLLEKGRTK